jgi:hypothetical protein
MKKMLLSISASLLFVLTCANFVSAQTVAGDWDVTVVSPNGPVTSKVTFVQEGEKLTAKMGPYAVTGSIKGSDVTLKYTVKYQDNDLPITMTGKLSGSEMKGDADFGGLAQGDWSAKKAEGVAAPAASSAAVAPAAGGAVAVVGDWDVVFETPNGDVAAKIMVKNEGGVLSGMVHGAPPMGDVPLKGTASGDSFEIKYTIKFDGNDLPITMKGKVEGGAIKGAADYGGMAEGGFKGKKQ